RWPKVAASRASRQLLALPPAQHPRQLRGKAALDLQRLAWLPPLGRGLVAAFPQLLAHGIGLAPQAVRQEHADRTQSAGAGHHHPHAPQRQYRRLGFAQVGPMSGDDLGALVACWVTRHWLPPASWNVWPSPSMPGCGPILPCLVSLLARHKSLQNPTLESFQYPPVLSIAPGVPPALLRHSPNRSNSSVLGVKGRRSFRPLAPRPAT